MNEYLGEDPERVFSLFTYIESNIMFVDSNGEIDLLSYNANEIQEKALTNVKATVSGKIDLASFETSFVHPSKLNNISTSEIRKLYSSEAFEASELYYKNGVAPSAHLLDLTLYSK